MTSEEAQALAEYHTASKANAERHAPWEARRGPITPIADRLPPSLTTEQVSALMAAHASDQRLIEALRKLLKARRRPM